MSTFGQVIILGIFAGTLLYQKPLRPPTTILLGLRKAAPFIAIMVIFLGALAQVPGQVGFAPLGGASGEDWNV
jgi:hypothetical protein